jgi:hypothetical protein
MAHINTQHPRNGFNPPETLTRTAHSVSIRVGNVIVGLINGWNPQQSRGITPIYELNTDTSGLPLENVPGNVTNLTIGISRYDIWPKRMEQAFGTVDLRMLSDQQRPFTVQEIWKSPTGGTEIWQYEGCWFQNIGRQLRSDDARLVVVSASLMYVYRSLITAITT